jgi:succinate-semialdehyde dehydrogenase/glutarate-semialdehyde dehydrogenase
MSSATELYEKDLGMYIDGAWCGAAGRETREVINPATEEALGRLPLATTEDLDRALAAAERAFVTWRNTSAWERATIMRRAAGLISGRKGELARLLTLENGKPLADSAGEIDRTVETIEWCAEEGKRTYGRMMPLRSPGVTNTTFKRPVGPVAAFAPWNFPAVLVARKVAAALATGCSIIVKPAEEAPAVCIGLVRAFEEAGLPPGVLNLVFGIPSRVSEYLIASPIIRKVSFTGSVPVGKLLSKLAADGLKAATMELGGHSPVVVFDDVDVDKVAAACAAFKFRNAGQVCLSPNRIFVQERVHDQFVDRFVDTAKRLKVGNGMEPGVQMGPLSNARRLQAAERFVEDARARGAAVRTGGRRIGKRGYFFEPTVLTGVDPRASIMTEEPFCPVAPILPFSTFPEVVERANAVEYGLAAYAFTSSINRASAISEAFDAGWIGINSFSPALADVPIGGVKQSGLGYEGGPEGLDAYLQIKFLSQADSL